MTPSHIEELESARRCAMLVADIDALEALLDEDLLWVHASASVDTRASFLAGFACGYLRCFRLDHTETQIRLCPDMALVSGLVHMEVAVEQVRRTSVNRYSAVYVRRPEGFRLIHWQSTRVPP